MATVATPRLTLRQITRDDAPFILTRCKVPARITRIRDNGLRRIGDARTVIVPRQEKPDLRYRRQVPFAGAGEAALFD